MRKLSIILVLVFVIGMLGACSGNNSNNSSPTVSTTTSSGQGTQAEAMDNKPNAGTTVRFIAGNHAWTTSIKPMLPEFEEKTGIKLVLEEYEINQATEKCAIELAAKSPSLDVMFVRPLSELLIDVKNGWLAEIDGYVENNQEFDIDDIMGAALDSFTTKDKLWGIPICTERQLLYYRKDLFEKAGVTPPNTMDELYEVAGKLHDPDNEIYGFVHRTRVGMCQIASFLYSFGGGYQDKNGDSILNSPETVAGYEFYGKILHDYGPPSPESLNYLEMFALFAQGKAAMISDVDANYLLLAAPESTDYSDVIGYAPFPAGPAGSQPINSCSFGLSISAFSENKDAAWEFIEWAVGKDVNNRIQANGSPTARISSWEDPSVNKSLPEELVEVNLSILHGNGGVGIDRPITLGYNEAKELIYEAVYEIVKRGGKDIKPILDAVNEKVQAVYNEYDK